MRLWLYSISCVPLAPDRFDAHPPRRDGVRPLQHEILLWCVDEQMCQHVVQVTEYKSLVYLLPKGKDVRKLIGGARALENVEAMFPPKIRSMVQHVEVWTDARLFIGYTQSKPKTVMRVFLKNYERKKDLCDELRFKQNKLADCIRAKEVLDKSIPATIQFLYESGLALQSWFTLFDFQRPHGTEHLFDQGMRHVTATFKSCKVDKNGTDGAPVLRKLFVRVFAHSSTATKTNHFEPSAELPEDEVRYIAYVLADANFLGGDVLDVTQFSKGEPGMLHAFGRVVETSCVQAIVFASDELVTPNCLVYLQKRASRYGINLHFSKITQMKFKCEVRKCKDSASSFLDFQHPGVERMDLCEVLKKAMVSPPLDGFTMIDALRHEKLIRSKQPFSKLLHLNYHNLHCLSKHDVIRTDLALFVQLLYTLERDNGFCVGQQNLSHICDLDLTSVCERGQQTRVRNNFGRKLHARRIVVNTTRAACRYLIQDKLQKDSAFPNPEQLHNPAYETMRSATMPRHVLKEPPLALFVEKGLLNLPHNNILPAANNFLPTDAAQNTEPLGPLSANASLSATHLDTLENREKEKGSSQKRQRQDEPSLDQKDLEKRNEDAKDETTMSTDNTTCKRHKTEEVKEPDSDEEEEDEGDGDPDDVDAWEEEMANQESEEEEPEGKQEDLPVDRPDEEKRDDANVPAKTGKRKGPDGWWSNKHDADFRQVIKKKPSRKKAASTKRYVGGLVLKPQKGFWKNDEDAAGTFDFGSLYPSIQEGYKLCYMTVIYKEKWLRDPKLKVRYIPLNDTECAVFADTYDGKPVETALPDIVHQIVQLRKETRKEQGKHEEGSFIWMTLESRQLAAKNVQNSVYGFTGSETSGMTCTAIAAATTNIGQWMNRMVQYVILFLGGFIFYGDTDSDMARPHILSHLLTRDEIFRNLYTWSFMVQKFCTSLFPLPNKLEFEAVKTMFLLLKKKTYAAIHLVTARGKQHAHIDPSVELWNLPPEKKPKIMGMTAKKRDKCEFAQNTGMSLIKKVLYDNPSTDELVQWYKLQLEAILVLKKPRTIEALTPFIVTCALNSTYKQTDVLALHLADTIEQESGARPRPNSRLPYVRSTTLTGKKKLNCYYCETPDHFLAAGHDLDKAYYIRKQMFNCAKQILSLDVHAEVLSAFTKLTEEYALRCQNQATGAREITQFFKPHHR